MLSSTEQVKEVTEKNMMSGVFEDQVQNERVINWGNIQKDDSLLMWQEKLVLYKKKMSERGMRKDKRREGIILTKDFGRSYAKILQNMNNLLKNSNVNGFSMVFIIFIVT